MRSAPAAAGVHPQLTTCAARPRYFSARGTIKRSDFGMKYGVPNIGDDIQIIIESEAVKA